MKKPMTPTELRKDLYRVLDDVLETGVPQEVIRGARMLMIVPAGGRRLQLDDLTRREALACSPEELVATSWEQEWSPES
ncbi:MAG TPA: type II toxin-antitoxin system Phd/YefM family antitoxin [Thermoanaerobaculia bacterium]|nr:type II toxin-antitoxin system Phd/YefM family antitoxin [Thermoanaerobaculia bacterium]